LLPSKVVAFGLPVLSRPAVRFKISQDQLASYSVFKVRGRRDFNTIHYAERLLAWGPNPTEPAMLGHQSVNIVSEQSHPMNLLVFS